MKVTLSFDTYEEYQKFMEEGPQSECKSYEVPTKENPNPQGFGQTSAINMPVQVPVSAQPAVPFASGNPGPVPVSPAAVPVTQPVGTPAQVPVTAAPQAYTFDQLSLATANLCTAGKQPEVHSLLQKFGVEALWNLPKDKYGDYATALRAIGGVI